MSEPVGNAKRSTPLPGSNSHSVRAAAEKAAAPPEPRDPITPVVTGKVIQKKPNVFKRMARGMVADDVSNVGDFVLAEVILPAFRNLVFDIISQGSHRVLFGTTRSRRMPVTGTYSMGPVTSLKTAYHKAQTEPETARYNISREDRARHNFDEIILDSHADAIEVLENLSARVRQYGFASVADLYEYLGVTGSFTDQKYGWTNLDNADVRHTRRGFVFDLPRATPLNR